MGMADIRRWRGVPAKRGMRVFDKHKHTYHPTWQLNYLDASGNVIHETGE